MRNDTLARAAQALLLLAAQALLLGRLCLWGLATPDVCPLLPLAAPLSQSRSATMAQAFLLGALVDAALGTPGREAAALTLCAFLARPLAARLAPRDAPDDLRPSRRTMGRGAHAAYALALALPHQAALALIDAWRRPRPLDALLAMALSLALSLLLMLALETMRDRRAPGGR